jgi:hypothetical protein
VQNEIIGALLGFPDDDLHPVQFEPLFFADIVVESGARLGLRAVFCRSHK